MERGDGHGDDDVDDAGEGKHSSDASYGTERKYTSQSSRAGLLLPTEHQQRQQQLHSGLGGRIVSAPALPGVLPIEQPPVPYTGATSTVPPPAKRKRGRPRSLVFNYFVRQQEPDGSLVNRCVFCDFKSRDKSQNPTYLARHCMNSCKAPPDVIEMLQQQRASSSHSTPNRHGNPASNVDDERSSIPSPNMSALGQPGDVRQEDRSAAAASLYRVPNRRTASSSPSIHQPQVVDTQLLPYLSPTTTSRQDLTGLGRNPGILPNPAGPSVLLSPPRNIGGPIATTGAPANPGPEPLPRHARSAVEHQQSPAPFRNLLEHSDQQLYKNQAKPRVQGRKRTADFPPDEGATAFAPIGMQRTAFSHPNIPVGHIQIRPGSSSVQEPISSHAAQQLTSIGGSASTLQVLPSISDVRGEISRHLSDDQTKLSRTQNQSVMSKVSTERQRFFERCTSMVHSALTNAATSTMICLGTKSALGSQFMIDQGLDTNNTIIDEENNVTLELQTMQSGEYDGICSTLALTNEGKLFFLGVDDCHLPSQLSTFVGRCTGNHLISGSFGAILFACAPTDAAIPAFSSIPSEFQVDIFLVVDVAHVGDEVCRQMSRASTSVTKAVARTSMIARFLTTHDLLPASTDVDAIKLLPNAKRFSAIVPAMLQLATHKQSVLNILASFQDGSLWAGRPGGESNPSPSARTFASTICTLLESNTFIHMLYNSVNFLEPISRLVALYDTENNGDADHRGIHQVASDCENAVQSLEQCPLPEHQVTMHASIARSASVALVGEKKSTVGAGVIVGNAPLLASFLDPNHVPPPEATLPSWKQQRLYHAVHIACNKFGRDKVDIVWAQLRRFMYEKEKTFSTEAISSAPVMAATPALWWTRFGRAAVPDLCQVALQILSIPTTVGVVARRVADVNGQDIRLRGEVVCRDTRARDHVFCVWNERLSRMKEKELLTAGSPLDVSLSDMSL